MQKFKSVDELINQLKPTEPVYCIRKKSIQLASKYFRNKFPGKILYAVKTNPHPEVLKTILESGIENFDVASRVVTGTGMRMWVETAVKGMVERNEIGAGLANALVAEYDRRVQNDTLYGFLPFFTFIAEK